MMGSDSAEALRKFAIRGAGLVDIGANITKLRGAVLEKQLGRAVAAGVSAVVVTGTSVKASRDAQLLVDSAAARGAALELYFTAGVHPHMAKTYDAAGRAALERLLRHPRCVAAGEMGLDYDRMFSPREVQLVAFRDQVEMAKAANKPLFLHERDVDARKGDPLGAHADLCNTLDDVGISPDAVCVHCFTGTEEALRDYAERGYYIGVTGFICMGKRGASLRAALKKRLVPLDRLLVETDAPYMKPDGVPREVGLKGRENEPCTLPIIVRQLAACYELPEEELAQHLLENSRRFFYF